MEKPENKEKKDLYLWYFDRYLPIAAGRDYYNKDHRHYKLLTDKTPACGKMVPCVSKTSEAFGLVMLDNCRNKWINVFKWKDDKKGAIPTKGEDSKQFQAKYTNSKGGQVKFGGWSDLGYEAFESYKKTVAKVRETDKKEGNPAQKLALKLMKIHHGIDLDQTVPKKKRKRSRATVVPKKRICTDDSDDEE